MSNSRNFNSRCFDQLFVLLAVFCLNNVKENGVNNGKPGVFISMFCSIVAWQFCRDPIGGCVGCLHVERWQARRWLDFIRRNKK